MAFYEVPLIPSDQKLTVQFGTKTYQLRVFFAGMWAFDLSDENGTPLMCGVPLLEGADLLGQYRYIGVPGRLWFSPDAGAGDSTYDNLGVTWHLFFEPDA